MEENITNNQQVNPEIEQEEQNVETSQNEQIEQETAIELKEEKSPNKSGLTLIAIGVSLMAIALSLFTLISSKSGDDDQAQTTPKTIQKGDLKIAYVNTDTILAKYDMAVEMQKELQNKQKQAEQSFQSAQASFQRDYQDFLKNGDKLTLTQQKEKEKELQNHANQITQMQTSLPMQLQEEQIKMNKRLLDAVYAFIADYNKKHDKFNIILSNSYASSPTLYIDKGMDITEEILKGLNEEYKNYKKD